MNSDVNPNEEIKAQESLVKKLYTDKQYKACSEAALQLIEKSSRPTGYIYAARALKRLGQNHDALTLLQEGYEKFNADNRIIIDLAKSYKDLGELEKAKEFCEISLKRAPSVTSTRILYSLLHEQLGQFDRSLQILQSLLKDEPENIKALLGIAKHFYRAGEYQKSLELLKKNQLGEKDHTAVSLLSKNYLALGKYEEALDISLSALKEAPQSNQIHSQIAEILREKFGNKSSSTIQQALSDLREHHKCAYSTLAQIAFKNDCVDLAEELYKRSLREDKDKEIAYEKCIAFYRELGDIDNVEKLLKECERNAISSETINLQRERIVLMKNTLEENLSRTISPGSFRLPELSYEALLDSYPHKEHLAPVQSNPGTLAVVIHSLGPGGAELQCANLLRGITSRRDHSFQKVYLLCKTLSRSEKDLFHLKKITDCPIEVIEYGKEGQFEQLDKVISPAQSELLSYIIPTSRKNHILQLIDIFRKIRPQVVHSFLDETSVVAALAARLVGIENIVVRWGNLPPPMVPNLTEMERERKRCFQTLYALLKKKTRTIFYSNARKTSDEYADWIGIEKNAVRNIPNGYDFTALEYDKEKREMIRKRLGIPLDANVIGGVFHITEKKRPFLWLDVIRKIVQSPHTFSILVGDGHLMQEIKERIAQYEIEDKVFLVGRQSEITEWYSAFDVLLLTSMSEGLPNVSIESQAIGVPVIVPDVGGCSETCIDGVTGYVVRSSKVEDYASSVSQIFADTTWLTKAKKAARTFVREKFSQELLAQRTLDLYQEHLPQNGFREKGFFKRIREKVATIYSGT